MRACRRTVPLQGRRTGRSTRRRAQTGCRGLDGVVCGHAHRAGLFERDGLVYANDGDWVESLTALSEDHQGRLQLLSHTGQVLQTLAPRVLRLPQAA